MLASRDRRDKRILAEWAEGEREAFEIVVGELLVGKGEDVMLEPGRADFGDEIGGQGL